VTGLTLLFAVGLLVANGFFVAVEFALLASRRTKLEAMAAAGSAPARVALGSIRHLNLQLAGAQLGITMASLLLGYVAGSSSRCPSGSCTRSGSCSRSSSSSSSTW